MFVGRPKVTLSLIRRYPAMDVRRLQFIVEEAFGDYIKATSVAGPPGVGPWPRFQMSDGRRTLAVADNSATLNLQFNEIPKGGIEQPLKRAAALMDKFDSIFADQPRFFSGIILDEIFSSQDSASADAVTDLYRHFLKNTSDQLHGLNFSVGERVDNIYRSFGISEYALVERQFTATDSGFINIDPDFEDVGETGVALKFDINTKPVKDVPSREQFAMLATKMPSALEFASQFIGAEWARACRDAVYL